MDLVAGVRAGQVASIAQLLSRAESGNPESRPALDAIFASAGSAHVVGITGVAGAGKSTLVSALAGEIRRTGRNVGIIAIDPSSPYTGGAILGDRVRMGAHAGDGGVFIRSMATRGAMGGLARGALEAVDVLDAAGYDIVIIETVGVGQDEIDVVRAAHTTVVVSAPGLGDGIQAIKAGLLEIADIHAVSKCDREDATRTMADLNAMLGAAITTSARDAGRPVPVIGTSAENAQGIDLLLEAIDGHRRYLHETGEVAARRRRIHESRLLKAGEELLRERFARQRDGRVSELIARIDAREMSPFAAAGELLLSDEAGRRHPASASDGGMAVCERCPYREDAARSAVQP